MIRRTSLSTSSRVSSDGPSGEPGNHSPSAGSTLTRPIFSDMPQRPTIARAIFVTCSRSDSAPVVTVP